MTKFYFLTAIFGLLSINGYATDIVLEDEVIVSVSRYAQKAFDTGASVNLINKEQIQTHQAQINLSESLVSVPGLAALNRQNYAQDLLISSRGFGANSTFGARGIKIYVDGIPATISDGQGQTSNIDLSSTEKIEVLRGPFTSIYGNSAGGVIQVFSEKGQPGTDTSLYGSYGSFGTSKYGSKLSGEDQGVNYLLDIGGLQTDGSRDHSVAKRDNQNAKLIFGLGEDSKITLVANRVSITAQDPLGLTATNLGANSQGSGLNASSWNSRKIVDQEQGGLEYLKKISNETSFKFMTYFGIRDQQQFQAPSATTVLTNGIYKGGVIGLNRNFMGFDSQLMHQLNLIGMPAKLTFGLAYDQNADRSTSSCNYYGSVAICPTSNANLYTDANYTARNFDQYLQLETFISEKLTLNAGIRNTNISLMASNNQSYNSSAADPNNWISGSKEYSAFLPMLSLVYALSPISNVYFSAGQGIDTPTLNQIKYGCANINCSTVSYTPNFLDSSLTTQYEIGFKHRIQGLFNLSAALFQADTSNEIVVETNIAGKSVYQNANHTQRKGLELLGQFQLPKNFEATLSYTYLIAQVMDTYQSLSSGIATPVNAGNAIPGVPKQRLFGEIYWKNPDQSIDVGIEMLASSGLMANDLNSADSAGYVIFNARFGLKQQLNKFTLTEFIRVNNIANTYYVGSVIVNQSSAQYYEPAPGFNWLIGGKASYHF